VIELAYRLTPFHADRRGKRHRYYVSQAKIQGRSTGHGSPIRVPARDIEEIVCSRILSLLRSPEELLHATGAEENSAAACESLIMAGKQLAKTWPSKSMAEQHEFLREVIARIVVGQTGLQIDVFQSSLQGALLGGQPDRRSKSARDVFAITIDAQIKRCGWEVRLVIPSDSGTRMPTRPALPLIKAVARVHHWPCWCAASNKP
jgi:site-specific DNA recombinase